jgi:cytochrome c5
MAARARALLIGCAVVLGAVGYTQAISLPADGVTPSPLSAEARLPEVLVSAHQAMPSAVGVPAMRAQAPAAGAAAPVTSADRALLNKYCVTCHNERRKTAGLGLDKADVDHVASDPEVWEKVVRKLRGREMPPNGSPRPDAAGYHDIVASLETRLDQAAAAHLNPGRVVVHRLNRAEYANAVRDALALDVDAKSLLGADETGYGFDNIADVLTISPGLLEQYKLAAWKISRLAVGDPTIKPVLETFKVSRFVDQDQELGEGFPLGSRGGTVIRHNFPLEGEYVLRIGLLHGYATHVIQGITQREEIDVRLNGIRVKLFQIGGECVGSKEARCQAFRPDLNTPLGLRVLPAEYDLYADKVLEVRFHAKAGPATLAVAFLERTAAATEGGGARRQPLYGSVGDGGGTMGLDHIEVEGPFNPTGPGSTPSRRRIFVCTPKGSQDEAPCARQILTTLARRLYRRPVTDHEIATLLRFYDNGRGAGNFDAGIQSALEALLVSPNFLLRVTLDPPNAAQGSAYRLNDLDLASRLSFFLWSSIPDDELLDAAARGKLHDPKVLEQQVRRMLADSKALALVDNFFSEWLSLRDLKNVVPDPALFPDFDENLRAAFQEETRLFLENQLLEDRSVTELLTANYTYLNERLARFYGIRDVYGPRFRRVSLTDPNRGGLLGQGSILTVTSYSTRTSPVVRGKWLLTNVLGAPPPPPPPNVPALVENGEGGAPPSSVRARMEQHRKNAVCASCHSRMDPLGFALENFSAIGRWRTTETGLPIDATGAFPDGTKFMNPAEFRTALLAHKEDFVHTLTTKMLTYAIGRGAEYYDMPAVRAIVREAAQGDDRWSSLILAIVKSTPFQMNRAPAPQAPSDQVTSAR